MPDLPEVDVLRRQLHGRFVGKPLHHLEVTLPGPLRKSVPTHLVDLAAGRPLTDVSRVGRILVFHLEDLRLLIHLRGNSRLVLVGEGRPERSAWVRLALDFGEAGRVTYKDDAKSPDVALCPAADLPRVEFVQRAGLEPLSPTFTLGQFKRILDKKKRRVKFALADDSMIAGLGSLYADETLFLAGVRPSRYLSSLTDEEIRDIYYSIFQVVQKSIRFCGLNVGGFVTLERKPGAFGKFLNVVSREDQPCRECQTPIRMVYLGGDRAYFCSRCQR